MNITSLQNIRNLKYYFCIHFIILYTSEITFAWLYCNNSRLHWCTLSNRHWHLTIPKCFILSYFITKRSIWTVFSSIYDYVYMHKNNMTLKGWYMLYLLTFIPTYIYDIPTYSSDLFTHSLNTHMHVITYFS